MATVSFPDQNEIEEQAAGWIAAIDRGLQAYEQLALDVWLEASPFHGEALVKCASMWDLLDVMQPIAKLMPIDQALIEPQATNLKAANEGLWLKPVMVACSVLMLAGVFVFSNLPTQEKNTIAVNTVVNQGQSLQSRKTYSTKVGQILSIPLSDGSVLELNTNSSVSVSVTKFERNIELIQGEVYFDVAKDPSKPFVVTVGEDRVTAIGTAFSIDAGYLNDRKQSLAEVIVTEGKVRVNSRNKNPLYLVSGQKATVADDDLFITDNTNSDSLLAWREGFVVFEGESLTQVIHEIDRYTPLKFKIQDKELASISVGGFFKTGDLDQLLLVLENNFGVVSEQVDNEIILSKAK